MDAFKEWARTFFSQYAWVKDLLQGTCYAVVIVWLLLKFFACLIRGGKKGS